MHNAKKLENVWVQLLCCQLLLRILFPREHPSPIMIVWFSVYSQHSEPEGEFRDDDNYDGFVHIPQPPLAPNIVNEGAGLNLVPDGDESIQAPEGAAVPPAPNIEQWTHDPTCQYHPARWIQGADGRMEHVNFCELRHIKAMGKLN